MKDFVRNDQAFSFLKNVRGSPAYYQRTFYDLLAMIRQLGVPTWFLTLSAADMKWPDVIQTIAKQYGVTISDSEVSEMSFDEKSSWLRHNPVTAARHFQYRIDTFFQDFLKSKHKPLGELIDYAIRIEFQARGSPHAHTLIWIKDAPKYGINSDQEVCDFIDQYISCNIPIEEGPLRDLVLLLQKHRHSSYCKRGKACRFHFPLPPCPRTLIAKPCDDNEAAKQVLLNVRKVVATSDNTDLTLTEILQKAGDVDLDEYVAALGTAVRGNAVVLKRSPNECNINGYNPHVMLAWQANMDIQFIVDAYACVMYVASYMMKNEKGMGELLKHVARENRSDDLMKQLRKVGSAFLTHHEVSAQEAAYRLLSLPMRQLSRSVVFINTNKKEERIGVVKRASDLEKLDDDDENVFQKSIIDRYQYRPSNLESMCLAEFSATYVKVYKCEDTSDALPPPDESSILGSGCIKLNAGMGYMSKRRRQAVIRFRKYNQDLQPSDYFRAKLMLYFPWRNEEADLLGGHSSYQAHYQAVSAAVLENERKYNQVVHDPYEVLESGPPQHMWPDIAPSTEESRLQAMIEGTEVLTSNMAPEDMVHNPDINQPESIPIADLGARFAAAANVPEIPAHEYRQMVRGLNEKQYSMVMYHRMWCKQAILAMKKGEAIVPYRLFISGPGGVGKSHIIRIIQSDTIKLLRLSGTIEPNDVIVLLTAFTGVAAFNIDGITLHAGLLLGCGKFGGYQPLNSDKCNTLRSRLSKLKLLIIDEVSMVGSNTLLEVHRCLQQIMSLSCPFGGVSVLAVGDLYQIPPIMQPQVFEAPNDCYAQFYKSGSLWKDEFQMIELDEIMRQRNDIEFAKLLCRVRKAECTAQDMEILKSREIKESISYPHDALHVYRTNLAVTARNNLMLNRLASQDNQYWIGAEDNTGGQTNMIHLSDIPTNASATGGLPTLLKLAVGARVMLTVNIDVCDGLVNGSRGEVVHVVSLGEKVSKVLVHFDDPNIGRKALQTSPYRSSYPLAVPISKREVKFTIKRLKGAEVTRLQFPLILAWASTIHKVQGLTLDQIVVDMKGGHFGPGLAYVAFSRVKSLNGLHLIDFNPGIITCSKKVKDEMERLSSNILPPLEKPKCMSLPKPAYTTIALLNIRSVQPKLCDIQQDPITSVIDIFCVTETWLSPLQPSPSLKPDHDVFRCDRSTGNHKGGVLLSAPKCYYPLQTQTTNSSSIEYVSVQLTLPSGYNLIILVVYRPPSLSLDTFLTDILQMLHTSASNLPSIILGDFNEDIGSPRYYRIEHLFATFGFNQIVQKPTTDSGTCIDHVYCNIQNKDISVDIHDTYYSDHDMVLVSLQF